MAFSTLMWMFAVILPWSNHALTAAAQSCYYPNGDIATDDSPCSQDVGICCPLNWQCMDNGLCYLENEDYYERHTCTDRSWPSDSCPRICVHNMQAPGNEAILWCNHQDWCCDGNRTWNCCTRHDTDFFDLPDPHSTAFISVTPSAVSPPSISTSTNRPSATTTGTESSAAPTSQSSASSTGSPTGQVAGTTNSDTDSSTIATSTSSAGSAAGSTNEAQHSKDDSSRFSLTIGLAVGIPLLLGLCGALTFFIFRRHRGSKGNNNLPTAESPPMEANYQNIAPGSHAPELQGFPVAAKRTKSGRYSELYGSDVNIHSPTLSTGTSKTSPPQYSPGAQQSPGMQHSPSFNRGGMAQVLEEPQELWGGYVPYRPPKSNPTDEGGALEGKRSVDGL